MFAQRLKKLRENAGLTQEELAKKVNLTQSTIAYYESGKKMPTLENAKIIAKIFNTSLDYLIGISDLDNKETPKKIKFNNTLVEKLADDINELSPESKKDLEEYIKLLKLRDMQKRNKENSDELAT